MFVASRPRTKLAAALLAAGVIATAPAVVGATPETLPTFSGDGVRNASFVTDALYSFGDVVSAAVSAVEIGTDLALGLNYYWDDTDFGYGVPINPVFWAAAFVDNPGSALSYLLQTYLNPSDNYVDPSNPMTYYYAYPWYVKADVLTPLVNVLPASLATAINDAINNVADGINDAFTNLPDPTAAIDSVWLQYNTPIGRLIYAAQDAIALPVTLSVAVAYYLAYLPADVEATVESAIQNPADIPGLVSHLIYGALDPNLYDGLLGTLTYNLVKPLFFLPSPIGESGFGMQDGLAYSAYSGFVSAVSGLLSNLPAPITPTPFPAAAVSASAAGQSNDAAAPENSAADDSGQAPKAHAQGQSARKAVHPTRSSAADKHPSSVKSGTAKKTKGNSTGGKGGSARAKAHRTA
ncbi:hypothetical protein ORI20_31465 [Mycobacterium sp. CVI_P3]|uniref:PE-PPE domain-containing protein n=1 Tax=Mycobacterium pinniadriaticum TaxID=2994102 RepID=A0ABT3SPV8_9MYCO|nr:hypothetical protein [Mycobacterium pinniadriaticum]MCX2934787.1 hypothetical protein [Mycobacterium pinniadriaticum]MCX2941214.1 hypothetical protein [Mycobacterium pinniadriaticum]